MANATCDSDYAGFLIAQKIKPKQVHIMHLLSIIGYAQYPDLEPQFNENTFQHASKLLGLPNDNQQKNCVALAILYAKTVDDLNDPYARYHDNYTQRTAYGEVYKIASDAILQWFMRQNHEQNRLKTEKAYTKPKDPSLITQAAVEILKVQPASIEQYCAWANTAHTWTALLNNLSENPQIQQQNQLLVKPFLDLPKQWQAAKVTYTHPQSFCALSWGMTDDYQTGADAVIFTNNQLRLQKIPCASVLEKGGTIFLNCAVKTTAWPQATADNAADSIY